VEESRSQREFLFPLHPVPDPLAETSYWLLRTRMMQLDRRVERLEQRKASHIANKEMTER
jgi:hypothetical protein